MKKIVFLLLISLLLVGFTSSAAMAFASSVGSPDQGILLEAQNEKIDPSLQAALKALPPGEMLTAIVTLREQADLRGAQGLEKAAQRLEIVRLLRQKAEVSQPGLQGQLQAMLRQGSVGKFKPFWVFNGFSVTATAETFRALADLPEVAWITSDEILIVPAGSVAYAVPETNLSVIHATALWDLGFTGQGVVVASMDSGVDASHVDLAERWRGGSNSWYDPYGQHGLPYDAVGHGTQVMGVMTGGDASGTSIGVAPQAQWIAVKIFNDAGSATATAIHLGYQWLLDPDDNPATDDAPDVVNNSWSFGSPGCNLEFQLDLLALRAAGILPVFAAGNYGPYSGSSTSPANNPAALAVGAVNNSDSIYGYSSRGPSACGEETSIFPELVAPGVNIHTTDVFGFYSNVTGTSLAAPHVTGALALLLSALPGLGVDQQQAALLNGALDLGAVGPDQDYGYGRLDVLSAYLWLQNGGSNPSPTPTSQPTSTPLPTPTPTPLPTATPTSVPATTLHIGDLDQSSKLGSKSWTAQVTIYVHGAGEQTISNATVTGMWTNGTTGTVSCKTDTVGQCTLRKTGLKNTVSGVTFTVTNVAHASLSYQPNSNHDPDGESNGTTIAVVR